jgi:hypothetical protein
MKIISIIKNDLNNTDLAVCLKDNFPDDGAPPTPQCNTTSVTHNKSGLPVLQVEFWRNEKFQKYFWFSEPLSINIDDDTDFTKRGCPWSEFLEIYNTNKDI